MVTNSVAKGETDSVADNKNLQRDLGSPAFSMIQSLQQDGGALICRDSAVGPGRKSAVIIESAGEPVTWHGFFDAIWHPARSV